MRDNEPLDQRQQPASRTPYQVLIAQSQKLGRLATNAYVTTRTFLLRDVPLVQSDSTDTNAASIPDGLPAATPPDTDEMQSIAERSHEILASARTVLLPVNLFPDSVVVDRTKVTITNRTFFWSAKTVTTRIEDILSVTSNTGPFFGSLTISTRVMNSTDHYEINYFWRRDAGYIKQIIQGYVIAQHNQIMTSHLDKDDLIRTLLELGRDSRA